MKRLISIGLLLTIGVGGDSFSQDRVPDNQTVLSGLMESIAEDVIQTYGLNQQNHLLCHDFYGSDAGMTWIMGRFYKRLRDSGVIIHFNSDGKTQSDQLYLNLNYLSIEYDGIYRERLWSRGKVIRRAGIILTCRYIRYEDAVLDAVDDFHQHAQDTVALRDLGMLERGMRIVRKPERPGERGIRKWVEPMVFGLALAGMAYSFYAVRSH